jgi:hypothetical protein
LVKGFNRVCWRGFRGDDTQVDLGWTSVSRFDSADLVISGNNAKQKRGVSQVKRGTVLGCWDFPSYVAVRQDALKLSRDDWSWELPRGQA